MVQQPAESGSHIRDLERGDPEALGRLLDYYGPRVRRMVRLWLDPGVRARVDPADVVQEVYLDAKQQVESYLEDPRVVFYVWLRGLARQRLTKLHRQHLTAQRRSARREEPLPSESSLAHARRLLAGWTSTSSSRERGRVVGRAFSTAVRPGAAPASATSRSRSASSTQRWVQASK